MSLGSGRATICGGGSCNPAKPKPTVRNRATTKPNQSNAHQSTPIQPELTLQSAWYSFWSRLRQPFSAMAKPYHRLHGDRTRRNPKATPSPARTHGRGNTIGDPIQSNPTLSRGANQERPIALANRIGDCAGADLVESVGGKGEGRGSAAAFPCARGESKAEPNGWGFFFSEGVFNGA